MTKVPATKKIQSSPASGALWPFYASDLLTQVPDKPMRSIKYTEKAIINLKKDLTRSRILIQWVKMGRGYFTILREESALKKRQQQLQKLKEEERNIFQPAKKMSDIQYGDILLTTYGDEKMKKVGMGVLLRPFTPVHSCIIAPSLPEAHVEPIFRQLCALHWLLEALTIDHTHHTMKPVITCWNPKDPGGSKSTIKKINKDKSMGQRWEHFITALKTKKFKVPVARVTSRKPSRRGSALSLSRTSGASSPQSSMVSVNPGSDEPQSVITQATGSKDVEDNESSSAKPEEEPLHVNLQKLLEMVREDAQRTVTMANGMQKQAASILSMLRQNKSDSAYKDMQTTRKSSDRSSSTSGDSHSQVLQKKSKRYFDLLSKLPEDLKNFRPAKKILAKLQKFGENLDLRIRPHVLLKVLQDMRVWELCSPDIAVAIEFVREHIIHMPQEDYINWLQNRINVPIRSHSAQM
ncbi:coiled-coil domain-containing protein 60 isoform X2 [Balaenoptera acutorostrata]|uniref:Coiled-coil domain-containing protein 60 isoform X2 n=1 Tax=Balaenoptera acutorostrata TaxID=9767 RepID=A0ABM3RZ08_BALAC|nr:coiled-coil domain-containing protein 60 isoform X2 [Balaenoptera acutorostrata]